MTPLEKELLSALRNLTRWVGVGIAEGVFTRCCAPGIAKQDLEHAEALIAKAEGDVTP